MSDREANGDEVRAPELDDEAEVGGLLAAAGPRPPLPEEDLAQIREALRQAWPPPAPDIGEGNLARPRRWNVALVATAMAALLAVAVGLVLWLRPAPAPAVLARVEAVSGTVELLAAGGAPRALALGDPLPAGAVVRTTSKGPAAGRLALRLASGAALRLDAGSRVGIAELARIDLQAGAVYVVSGSPGAVGIAVTTPLGTVRELGTKFAVRLAESDPASLLVSVREGAVAHLRGGRRHVAQSGEALVIHADGSAEKRAAAVWGPEWAWVAAAGPPFATDGRTVRELLDWVAAETGWRIELADPAARASGGVVLHGSIGSVTADRAAFAVLPGAGLEAEQRDGTLIVRAAR